MSFKPSARLSNIKNLKEKVMELQRELSFLEKVQVSKSKSKSPSPSLSPSPKYQSSKSPKASADVRNFRTQQATILSPTHSKVFKNPTFWGDNPIVGKQNLTLSPSSRNFKQPRDHIRDMMAATTRLVFKAEGQRSRPNFNQTCHNLKSTLANSPKPIIPKFNPEDFVGDAPLDNLMLHKYMAGRPSENTPRFKKITSIKTSYNHNDINPILQPPAEKKTCRKACITRNLSPQTLLTEHDKSNTQMYILSSSKTPIFLSPQNRSSKKNKSDIIRDLLSSSTERIKADQVKGKKHFKQRLYETVQASHY